MDDEFTVVTEPRAYGPPIALPGQLPPLFHGLAHVWRVKEVVPAPAETVTV
jgi:hypothetical protein